MKFTKEWSEAALIHGVRSGGSEAVAEAAWGLGTEEGLLSVSGHSGGSRHSTCLRHNQLSLISVKPKQRFRGWIRTSDISVYGIECCSHGHPSLSTYLEELNDALSKGREQ